MKYFDTQLLAGLLELGGHWQNGSNTPIMLFQDDATRSYHLCVGDDGFGKPRQYNSDFGFRDVIEEAIEGDAEALDCVLRIRYRLLEQEALIEDGQRFRRMIALLAASYKHECLDDAGPHPALARLKELAEPILESMEDSADPTVSFEGLPAVVRYLLDQLHAEGLAP